MINLLDDNDMKIAGEKPSLSIKKESYPQSSEEFQNDRANGNIQKAKDLGEEVAKALISACKKEMQIIDDGDAESSLAAQRVLLLSFAATVAFERSCPGQVTANTAQNTFFDKLQQLDADIYEHSCDTGAFSFYFLAYRSGGDTERRIGQTFAMICGHDGDPIYQELGEALYCWFLGLVEDKAKKYEFKNRRT